MIDPAQPDYANTPASPRRPGFDYEPADRNSVPGVSIITPFFNTGSVFHETARTVLAQSFQQWEWIVVDDGSTDPEALAILAEYEGSDPRVRVVHHGDNRGLSAARNTGFREAKAPNVVPLDSDDLLETTAIEKWLWFLESHPEYGFVKGYTVGFGAQEYLWEHGFHEGRAFLRENLVAHTSMIRRSVHTLVGGYDESVRGGLEDWEFWLRCASHGVWGGTVPEFLDWYRRRTDHSDRWSNWNDAKSAGEGGKNGSQLDQFRAGLRRRYPKLWNGGFPAPENTPRTPVATLAEAIPWANALGRQKPRLLLIVPWLTMGGADKFNLDLLEQLTKRGWEVTVATTLRGDHSWLAPFAAHTPEVFALSHFLHTDDYPRFLRYLIASRGVQAVMISNSESAYRFLPYLRAHAPDVAFLDYCHMEEEHWNVGGYPRMAVDYQPLLDVNLVSSHHLKSWMVQRGAEASRIRVCPTNVDTIHWRPDSEARARIRQSLGVADTLPVLLYHGRICEQKQPKVFAETMRLVARRGTPFLALVAGDGPDAWWLQDFVRREHLQSHVRLLGAQPNARIRELLMAADLFFLPSRWEGIALSIYEAMACGLPIVGADVGGQRELVTPECGILLPPADPRTEAERYAAVLRELLADPERRRDMGAKGRARVVAQFRLDDMADNIVRLLEDLQTLDSTHRGPIPDASLARVTAINAVEHLRLADAFNRLHHLDTQRRVELASWRSRTYFTVQRFLMPYYRRALQREIRWIVPLKESIKRQLLRPRPSGEPPGTGA